MSNKPPELVGCEAGGQDRLAAGLVHQLTGLQRVADRHDLQTAFLRLHEQVPAVFGEHEPLGCEALDLGELGRIAAVPHPNDVVVRGRRDEAPVRAEGERFDIVRMVEPSAFDRRAHRPSADLTARVAGRELLAVRAEREGLHRAARGVADPKELATAQHLPDPNRADIRGGGETAAVGRKSQRRDGAGIGEAKRLLTARKIPQTRGPVTAGGGEELAVGRKSEVIQPEKMRHRRRRSAGRNDRTGEGARCSRCPRRWRSSRWPWRSWRRRGRRRDAAPDLR